MNETLTRRRIQPTLRASKSRSGWLRVVQTADTRELDRLLPVRSVGLELGRKADDGVSFADPMASRRHCAVRWKGQQALIEDLGSANGTWLDGVQLAPNTPVPLPDGGVLRIGDTVLLWLEGDPTPRNSADSLGIFGRSPALEQVRRTIRLLGPSDLPVLVCGPTGAGKELVARALHLTSERDGELVALNCPALPGSLAEDALFGHVRGAFTGASTDHDGAFVRADRGTLFLDEVGDMAQEVQPKLLRALETGVVAPIGGRKTRRVDVRVVAATNVDLPAAVDAGDFREDLLARLAGATLVVPALAERRDDIVPLFRRFLGPAARSRPAEAEFVEALLLRPWRRNVRELRNLARRLEVLHPSAPVWTRAMLDDPMTPSEAGAVTPRGEARPQAVRPPSGAHQAPPLEDPPLRLDGPPTREELEALLERFGGNITDLARHVGRSRKQVYRWIKRHDLDPKQARQ